MYIDFFFFQKWNYHVNKEKTLLGFIQTFTKSYKPIQKISHSTQDIQDTIQNTSLNLVLAPSHLWLFYICRSIPIQPLFQNVIQRKMPTIWYDYFLTSLRSQYIPCMQVWATTSSCLLITPHQAFIYSTIYYFLQNYLPLISPLYCI